MSPVPRSLRWTEHAVTQLAAIAEYISLDSPVYAEDEERRGPRMKAVAVVVNVWIKGSESLKVQRL